MKISDFNVTAISLNGTMAGSDVGLLTDVNTQSNVGEFRLVFGLIQVPENSRLSTS